MRDEKSLTAAKSLWGILKLALDAPWKARNEIERVLLIPLAHLRFRFAGARYGRGWKLYGLPIIQKHRGSVIEIGNCLSLRSQRRSNPLVPAHPTMISTRRVGAEILIGEHFGMTGGVIVAQKSVRIGNRVLVGANTVITDTDFHPLEPEKRFKHLSDGAAEPVVIEDDVFIGMNSLILKGVRIGKGSVIGAGSVVTHDIQPGMIAAGNPAQEIRPVSKE